MADGQVIALCGKIAAGKTTYATWLKKEKNAVLLSCDDLLLTLFDSCLGEKHDETVVKCSDYLHRLAVQIAEAGNTVVLDFGYWTKCSRQTACRFFQTAGVPFSMVWVTCQEEVRTSRLEKRNELLKYAPRRVFIIDEEKLHRLDAKFEPPEQEENIPKLDTTMGIPNII